MLNDNTGIYCKSASNVESRKSSRFPPIKYETGLGIRGPFVDSSSASNSSCLSFRPRTYTKLKFSLKAGMTSSQALCSKASQSRSSCLRCGGGSCYSRKHTVRHVFFLLGPLGGTLRRPARPGTGAESISVVSVAVNGDFFFFLERF